VQQLKAEQQRRDCAVKLLTCSYIPHGNGTKQSTSGWVIQQLREAFPPPMALCLSITETGFPALLPG
jgi:hypothetical protein